MLTLTKKSASLLFLGLAVSLTLSCSDDGLADAGTDGPQSPDFGYVVEGGIAKDAICGFQTQEVGLLPLDMLIVLDTSFSMDFEDKWFAVKEALKAFAASADLSGSGMGLQYFPLRKQCSIDDYGVPAVSIASLPGAATSISNSLEKQRMAGGTPMVPMLQGVMTYVAGWAKSHGDRKVVVVLASDGIPDDTCLDPVAPGMPNTLDNVVKIAGDAANGKTPIATFVIGVGTELTALNQIAQAGSNADAILVDSSKDTQNAFVQALATVRKRALSCSFEIKAPADGALDYNQVNVAFTTNGQTETFYRVGQKDECIASPTNAWYYDDPIKPTTIVLCEDTCTRVQAANAGKVDLQFGCATVVK